MQVDMTTVDSLTYASTVRPCRGEHVSGDSVVFRPLEQGLFVAIVDVLGHGMEAHQLTHRIEAYLLQYACYNVAVLIRNLHQNLLGSRGAAVGLCAINATSGSLDYVGIGNTTMRRIGGAETRLVSREGVLGQNMRTPYLQTLQLEADDLVVLHTDGISERFSAEDYPSLSVHSPQQITDNIVARFGKDHDDATCVAVRYSQ